MRACLLLAAQAPANHGCFECAAGLVIAPFTVDKTTGKGQLIGAALVLAQNLHRLVWRRSSFAVELSQPFLARCHLEFPLIPGFALPDASTARDCGFSMVTLELVRLFAAMLLHDHFEMRFDMVSRISVGTGLVALSALAGPIVHAQDVPGIEICTVEKTMERRTSCLQSNVEFLQKTIAKLSLEHQQKLDAAKAQIEALKASLVAVQKIAGDLQASQQRMADELKKKADAPPKDTSPSKDAPSKEGRK